jgi:hypothetical protein
MSSFSLERFNQELSSEHLANLLERHISWFEGIEKSKTMTAFKARVYFKA